MAETRAAAGCSRELSVARSRCCAPTEGWDADNSPDMAGISYSYLTEIENGNEPASNTVLGPIADALGVRLHELIADAEDRAVTMDLAAPDRTDAMSPPTPSSAHRLPAPWRRIVRHRSGHTLIPPIPCGRELAHASARDGRADTAAASKPAAGDRGEVAPTPNEGALLELVDLYRRLEPDDRQRVLDLARRLIG